MEPGLHRSMTRVRAAARTAAVARGAPEVAFGARVAPPPGRSEAEGRTCHN